ncbi:ATP-binding protein [Vibrio hannami]|uniref:ATP-binding protein n=1 Tax=Vibrio hannami TaxID=2717094 RepID=UPI003EB9988F
MLSRLSELKKSSVLKKLPSLKHLSIRTRLMLAASLWIGGLTLAAGIMVPTLVNTYLVDNTRSQLQVVADEIIANLTISNEGKLTLQKPVSDSRYNRPYSGFYWIVTSKNQTLRSRSLWDKSITPVHKKSKVLTGANGEKLISISQVVTIPEYRGRINITIGIDEDPIEDTLDNVIEWLLIIQLVLFAGLLVFTFVQVNWSLIPLNKLQKELKTLEQGKQQALSSDYPGEIKPLVADLNALLFHYQELLERARNHAGNLSHSLKTPLSVIKNQISELPEEEQQSLSQTVAQLQQQIDYHLGRARMAGAMNILSVSANPSERVDAISTAFEKVYSHREVVMVNELDSELNVAVESTDLDEMLGNLIENSFKWANSLIRVYGNVQGDVLVLTIEDDGKGVEDSMLEEIVKRGVRLDETIPGTGLGLNIVAEMAHSYRGELSFERSSMGGLKAILRLNLSR